MDRNDNPLIAQGQGRPVRGEAEHDKCISRYERADRDTLMDAVRCKIASGRIPGTSIRISGRPMNPKYRERIMRYEYDQFSLRRALLIATEI